MVDRNSLPPQVIDALKRGNKIEAIKLLRAALPVGLAEAKSVLEALERASGNAAPQPRPQPKIVKAHPVRRNTGRPREDDLSPGEEPRSSASPVGIVIAIAAVVAAAWLYVKFGG
jgi:hypothetical protein